MPGATCNNPGGGLATVTAAGAGAGDPAKVGGVGGIGGTVFAMFVQRYFLQRGLFQPSLCKMGYFKSFAAIASTSFAASEFGYRVKMDD